jgi:DNA-binding MarR family transcriptional regulator
MFVMDDIQKALKQTKPFGSREEAAYLAIQLAAEDLRSGFSDLFKTKDLTGAQYNVLRILRGAGKAGISCREIGERMINRDSDITRMLDRLEARNLITRERQTDDRRVVLAFIVENGLTILKELDRPVDALHKAQLGHLSEKELETITKLLGSAQKPEI